MKKLPKKFGSFVFLLYLCIKKRKQQDYDKEKSLQSNHFQW